MVCDWNSLFFFLSVYCCGLFIIYFFQKERDVMYGSLGSLGTRVHDSLVMVYIQRRVTFRINAYFVLVVRCCLLVETVAFENEMVMI